MQHSKKITTSAAVPASLPQSGDCTSPMPLESYTTEKQNIELLPLGQLQDTTRLLVIKKVVLSISVITGWPLPQGELLGILLDQVEKMILEKFYMFTADQIEFAFRSRCAAVKNWGAAVNLALLNEVLSPALPKKCLAEAKEEYYGPYLYKPEPVFKDESPPKPKVKLPVDEHFYNATLIARCRGGQLEFAGINKARPRDTTQSRNGTAATTSKSAVVELTTSKSEAVKPATVKAASASGHQGSPPSCRVSHRDAPTSTDENSYHTASKIVKPQALQPLKQSR